MANTFVKIASVTVGAGGAASMDFTSIPQTYTDLQIITSARTTNANIYGWYIIKFNGSSSTVSTVWLEPNGTSVPVGTGTSWMYGGSGVGAGSGNSSLFDNGTVYIPNYTSTSLNKVVNTDEAGANNTATAYMTLASGLWTNTSAITSVSVESGSGTFVQYSTSTLYGILKA
jgi:hypothetical protein